MKPIKMFGLAALAALMAMAFAGASSAMAEETALCPEDTEACIAIQHVHETTLTGKKAVLKTSILTVECDVLFLGDTLGASGIPLVIHGKFTYTNCGGCSATEENGPAEIKVLKEGHETASVTGEGLVHVECSGLNCRYNGTGLKGTGKGPLLSTETNGEVKLTEQTTSKESGLFCPSTSKLTITTTPLEATYIGSEGEEEGGGSVSILVQTLMTLGNAYKVTIDIGGAPVTISGEGWGSEILKGLGSNCIGKWGPGTSCTTQELACVGKGETKYFLTTSVGVVFVNIKCD